MPDQPNKTNRQRKNVKEKRALRSEQLADYMRKSGRKAPKRGEPNDRRVDHGVEKSLQRLPPEEWDRLLHDGEED